MIHLFIVCVFLSYPARRRFAACASSIASLLGGGNKKWESCFDPIDPQSNAEADRVYTLAYLHHLIRAEEILGLQVCSIHNLRFYLWLVGEARNHILAGDYASWKASLLPRLGRRL